MKNIRILIAAHKPYTFPEDGIYLPIHVGAEGKESFGVMGDNTGDNMSIKNPYYSELTAIYWAWKNLDADYIGLAHYRRHFSLQKKISEWDSVLTEKELIPLLEKCDVILPKKRNYYIESVYSHYKHTHDIQHLDKAREIIAQDVPEYLNAFDTVMKRTGAHMFNMMIMKKEYFHLYCSWLFPILFSLEKQFNIQNMSSFDARLFGRVSELLLDVWIDYNKIAYKEIGYVHIGKIDWPRKIRSFLAAKFFNKKYKSSF